MVPWLDLTRQYQQLRGELTRTLDDLMSRSSFILGPYVDTFEADFARFVGSKHCIGLNSGTSALHLALLACGVERGDEVITTPATWISTCWAISYVGAKPVFVDIDPQTCGLDADRVEHAITSRTRAILPVHLYGQAADIAGLCSVAVRHDLPLIEDACQAHAATFAGKHLGTFGAAGCFSFYPGKNLGAFGEAGALVTDDDAIARRVRQLRDHAQAARHHHVEIGYNMRMEGVQGAVLGVKLPHLGAWTERRRAIGARYDAAFGDLSQFRLMREPRGVRFNRHIYPLCCDNRESLRDELTRRDVQTAVHYPTPVHLQPAYQYLGHRPGDFPHAEKLCATQVTLPMFPELSDAEVTQTIDAVRAWAKLHDRAAA
ncbi:MAG: DegT/DnrJ/EryC1/StrS family aminotransferase [Planctomycetes bacterium]|nr:DegT/DnrJ/EryC1/StrS family aminotransferase [Planctomycetota bacterium]